jgi:hypothetical protein
MVIEFVDWLPEVSVAIAVSICAPSATVALFHDTEYDEPFTVTVPFSATESTWNWTVASPTVEVAFAATSTVRVIVELLAGALTDTTDTEDWANATSQLAKIKCANRRKGDALKTLRKGNSNQSYIKVLMKINTQLLY